MTALLRHKTTYTCVLDARQIHLLHKVAAAAVRGEDPVLSLEEHRELRLLRDAFNPDHENGVKPYGTNGLTL